MMIQAIGPQTSRVVMIFESHDFHTRSSIDATMDELSIEWMNELYNIYESWWYELNQLNEWSSSRFVESNNGWEILTGRISAVSTSISMIIQVKVYEKNAQLKLYQTADSECWLCDDMTVE